MATQQIDRISNTLQHAIKAIIGANRKPPHRLKNFLNGTWFGHKLHPAITDVVIGALLLVALFDIIWLISPHTNAWAALAGKVAIIVAGVAALGSIITGIVDWSETSGSQRRLGLLHGSLNIVATLLYGVSAALRMRSATGESLVAALLSFVGLACILLAAYLGGELVFKKGTGVDVSTRS